ncbi:MAG: hypothetical protein LBN02_04985 [Oscillospiraceae bacterium]|jgi:uncharacterized membrane protein|nr:hypothetical protein [Oscillospiraceae bacterium]
MTTTALVYAAVIIAIAAYDVWRLKKKNLFGDILMCCVLSLCAIVIGVWYITSPMRTPIANMILDILKMRITS